MTETEEARRAFVLAFVLNWTRAGKHAYQLPSTAWERMPSGMPKTIETAHACLVTYANDLYDSVERLA